MNDTYVTGTNVAYDGLGQIAATANTDTERPAVTDEFRFDGVGNVLIRHANKLSNEANTEARDSSVYLGHQLTSRTGAHFPDGRTSPLDNYSAAIRITDSLGVVYDHSGNVTTQVQARREWVNGQNDGYGRRDSLGLRITSHWYDADERLRVTQLTTMPAGFSFHTQLSEYRYDALGRRIAVRARVDSIADCASETVVTPLRCQQEYVVTTWDGNQVLAESRTLGGWQLNDQQVGATGSGDWWGTVRYTQTGAIDAPRVLWRDGGTPRILHRNWRGSVAGATFASSGSADNATVWPAVNDVWYAPDARVSAPEPNKWMGSLVLDGRDATGTLYRRNRYYDPASGRFTQEDPIGVAGGVNLYGYGDGDPVNNNDPFGLCPWTECLAQGLADWGAHRGGALGKAALNAGAAINAGSEALGINLAADAGDRLGSGDLVGGGALALAATVPIGRVARVSSALVRDAAGALSARIGKSSVTIAVENGFKRVDLVGRSHGGVPTPHVHDIVRHTNPRTGASRLQSSFRGAANRQDIVEAARASGQLP
jgi:RHS repeat-associated protein